MGLPPETQKIKWGKVDGLVRLLFDLQSYEGQRRGISGETELDIQWHFKKRLSHFRQKKLLILCFEALHSTVTSRESRWDHH